MSSAFDVLLEDDRRQAASAPACAEELSFARLDSPLLRRLYLAQERVAGAVRSHLASLQMRPGALSVLALVEANPGVSQIELARQADIHPSTLVSRLDELEQRGWIVRLGFPKDRRRWRLETTPPGRAALNQIAALADRAEAEAAARLGENGLKSLLDALDVICPDPRR